MKNNKFTDGKIGDKGGEMKKQAKGNETPQRASRQVLGDLGLLFCGDEACDNREDHKQTICTGLLFFTRLTNLSNFSK